MSSIMEGRGTRDTWVRVEEEGVTLSVPRRNTGAGHAYGSFHLTDDEARSLIWQLEMALSYETIGLEIR